MNWRIRIWLIKLEKVADDIDLDFAVVEVVIEFFYACTSELTFNLILFIASTKLKDYEAFCLTSQDASRNVWVLNVEALWIVASFEKCLDLQLCKSQQMEVFMAVN